MGKVQSFTLVGVIVLIIFQIASSLDHSQKHHKIEEALEANQESVVLVVDNTRLIRRCLADSTYVFRLEVNSLSSEISNLASVLRLEVAALRNELVSLEEKTSRVHNLYVEREASRLDSVLSSRP